MATRLDLIGSVSRKGRTPQGGISSPANFTRTGVLLYRMPDGSVRRELRHPEDVFHPESLDSLRGAPVTIGHPGKVDPSSYRKWSVGHVGDDVAPNGQFVSGTARVQDKSAVERVDSGDLVELSCGYDCDTVEECGTFEGERYDARQTNIRYNHVGLGPLNWGRAGNDVRLRMDGEDVPYTVSMRFDNADASAPLNTTARTDAAPAPTTPAPPVNVTVHTDSAEVERLRGENAVLRAKVSELEAVNDPARMDAALDARFALHSTARGILGESVSLKGKTDREIMQLCVASKHPTLKCDGQSDDFVRGMFQTIADAPHPSLSATRADAAAAQTTNGATSRIDAARNKFKDSSAQAWKSLSAQGVSK